MIKNPNRILFAFLPIILFFWSGLVPIHAVLLADSVTSSRTLQQVANTIQSSTDTGVFQISFSTYKNINQFKLDAPSARIDSLIFQRNPKQESDSAINVDATLFDIKGTKGTVVLRGLAFNLTKPKSVLIAGSELGKENLHLVIDSCFIYADTLDGVFLSWAAGNAGTIEIRHSFFVSKTGTVVTKLSLSGGKVVLQNNLFNFPGVVAPTVAINADIKSNTFNRTQLTLSGDPSLGIPTYNFNRNLIAHHGTVSAIGSPLHYFAYISGLNNTDAVAQNNHLYKTWTRFNLLDTLPFSNSNSNQMVDTIVGKPSTELWNWYTSTDTLSGFPNGTTARKIAYNVFPDSITFPWTGPSNSGKVFFKSALFPRQMAPSTSSKPILSNLTILANPTLRFFQPAAGPVHFGPFQVDSISVAVKPSSGHPVLLASDSSTGVYKPQPQHSSTTNDPVSMYTNTLASARYFFLSFFGNTARGTNIVPTSELGKDDSLVFEKVDSAGYTTFYADPSCSLCTNNLRYLKCSFHFRTTATLKDSMTFGLKDSIPPFRSDSLFWMLDAPGRLVNARKTSGINRKVYAKVLAESSFTAFLVEKLSVPKGGVTFNVPDGTVRAEADFGYQITLDSLAVIDKIHYGQSTHAYGYSAQGRLPGDSLTLRLKWKPDQEAFRDSLGKIRPLSLVPDTAGMVKIALKPSDTGKTYFLAVKYNILADSLYNGAIEGGVVLANFKSSTAAKSKFVELSSTVLNNAWLYHDSAFKSTLFLSGKEFKTNGANPVQHWDMTFTVNGATHRDSVEAWWSDGKVWTQIISPKPVFLTGSSNDFQVKNIPDSARYIVAVERLPPPETYVSDTVSWANNILHVTVIYKRDSLNKSIDQYCVELKSIDHNGQTVVPACDPKPIGTPADIKLNANTAYIYQIQYFSKGVQYGNPSYQTLKGPSWDRSIVLPTALSLKPKNFWHLVGFPFAGTLAKSIVKDETIQLAKGILDTIVVMHIENANGKQKVDTLKGWSAAGFNSGDAFLIGGTRSFNLKMDPESNFLPLGVVRMPLDSGWHFLTNPFPTTLATNKIRSVKWGAARFWELVPPTDSSQLYRWDFTGSLKAFSGYAYHTRTSDTLIFDLFADSVPTNPLPKTSSWPTLIKVAVLMPTTSSQMYLTTQSSEQSIPYFPAPGAGVELRLGGGQGFLLKAIPNLQAMDEPLTIRAMQDGHAAFSVGLSPELLSAANVRIRLIDLGTGKVYVESELADLPLFKGSHNYRLLMGTAAFVEERITGFLNEMPQSIGLSQNYPNPTRGVTRFLFAWPAIQSQERHAVLQILDTRGRELRKVPLEHIQVGRQELTLDFKNWKPGIYLYRLTVFGDGQITRLQKRMLIAP